MNNLTKSMILSGLVCLAGLAACSHYRPTRPARPEPVPFSQESRQQLEELRESVVHAVNAFAQGVSRDQGGDAVPPLERFTVTVSNGGANVDIEMEPIIVIGDSKGCVKDPPGISCECPCP